MSAWRRGLLFSLASLLALVALAAPFLWKGFVQGKLELVVGELGGSVEYDCDQPGRRRVGLWYGTQFYRQFFGNIVDVRASLEHNPSRSGLPLPSALLDLLQTCGDLETLALIRGKIDAASAEKIGRLQSLTSLTLPSTAIADLTGLSVLTSLENLDVAGSTGITPAALDELAKLPALEILDLTDTDIDGSALARIRNFPNLKLLRLEGTRVAAADLAALDGTPQLSEVTVSRTIGGAENLLPESKTMPRVIVSDPRPVDDPSIVAPAASSDNEEE